jgi:phage terminase small subunit
MAALANAKHELFALAIVEGKNGADAYAAAGYSVDRKVASVNAVRLLDRDDIKARIAELQGEHRERHTATVDNLVAELTRIAFANAGDFFHWGPDGVRVKDKDALSLEQQSVVAEVSQTVTEAGGTIRVKLHSKLDAIDKLGRHLGMFKHAVEVTGKDGATLLPEPDTRSVARAILDVLRTANLARPEQPSVEDDEPDDEEQPEIARAVASSRLPIAAAGGLVIPPVAAPPPPPPAERKGLAPGESEVFDNGATITRDPERNKYVCLNGNGELCGYRVSYDVARQFAQGLPRPRKEPDA